MIGQKFNRDCLADEKHRNTTTWYYLDLVDVAENSENTINIDTGLCADGILRKYQCPKTIIQNVVKVLRYLTEIEYQCISYPRRRP